METVVKKLIDFNGCYAVVIPKSWVLRAGITTHVQLRYSPETNVVEIVRVDNGAQ